MSSFKKASKVNQRIHRERHQPEQRAHLGLLEKKKDYKFRADEYHKKQKVLKKLQIAALNKNPDEFNFHMINSKVVDGIHREKIKPPDEDTIEQKKLMENRNITYVAMKRTVEMKKVEKLQSNLHLTDLARTVKSSHIHFNDELKPKQVASSSNVEIDIENLSKLNIPEINDRNIKKINHMKEKSYKTLVKRIERTKQLTIIQRKMEVMNHLKNKCELKPKLVKPGSKNQAPVYQWQYERKR